VKDAIRSHRVAGAECNLLSNAGIFLKTAKSLTNSYGVAVIEKVQRGNYQKRKQKRKPQKRKQKGKPQKRKRSASRRSAREAQAAEAQAEAQAAEAQAEGQAAEAQEKGKPQKRKRRASRRSAREGQAAEAQEKRKPQKRKRRASRRSAREGQAAEAQEKRKPQKRKRSASRRSAREAQAAEAQAEGQAAEAQEKRKPQKRKLFHFLYFRLRQACRFQHDTSSYDCAYVRASRIGYYTLSEYITIAEDHSQMIYIDLVISPKLSLKGNIDMYRIVLTWGKIPRDLDSYILTTWPTSDKCKLGKVFYNERKCAHGSESISLDVDATNMHGPETITLTGVASETFIYYVHIYTNGVCWNQIDANVKLYQASTGGLLYNIDQPKCSQSGTVFSKYNCSRYWNVLTFDASTAKFKIHPGRFTNTAPTLKDHGIVNPKCNCSKRSFFTGNDVINAARKLSQEATKLNVEKLCVKEMEKIYKNAQKKDIGLNPSESAAKIATFVSNQIKEKRRLALSLKTLIEKQYEKNEPRRSEVTNTKEIAQKQCCTYDGDTSYSTTFKKWVDKKSSCWSWPKEIKEMPYELVAAYDRTEPLEKEMIKNSDSASQKGELKWQYFTDDNTGFHRKFPAEVLGNTKCGAEDQRLQPWYIEGVRGPKNVIILFDISYAMKEENKYKFARTAVVQVLKGMLNNDFTNLIAFAQTALLPGMTHGRKTDDTYNSCLKSQLVQANGQNKQDLERFVQDVMLASEKTVNYYNAIATALKVVANTNNKKDTHLIFVTGSQDTSTENIPTLIRNASTTVNVHVYHLVGNVKHSYIKDSSAKLAEMASINSGKLETIYDYSTLAFVMGRFYKNMQNEQTTGSYVTPPQFDVRLGMYVTLGVPCYTKSMELIGVVGIDTTLSELLKNTEAFGPGELSYNFVIETDTGRALVHPQLPVPESITNEPIFINIKYLEQSAGFSTVLVSMMRRETGTKVLHTQRVLSRGNPEFNGYRGVTADFTYSWRPVNNTNFAVCVVVANDELDNKVIVTPQAYPEPDLYHRYDIVKYLKVGSIIEDKPIAFLNNITFPATLSRSNYFLSSSCFTDPYRFENTAESLEFVKELSDYVDGKRSVQPMQALKKEVLADIRLTRHIEKCWNRNPMRVLGADAAWRYIATNSGAMRQYPGRQTFNNRRVYIKNTAIQVLFVLYFIIRYDPTTRPWYHAAKSYPGKLDFSVPYLDNGGAGVVVTTSQTISSDSMVRAVMGIDWKMNKINNMVTGSGAICRQDTVHDNHCWYMTTIVDCSTTQERHSKKPICFKSKRIDELIILYFSGKVEGTTRCGGYIMVPVPNTNIYLVALDGGNCPDPAVKCRSCSMTFCADGITKDRSSNIPICVPCVCSVRYNPCALHYYQSPNAAVVCPSIARNKVSTKIACKKPDTDSTVLKGPKIRTEMPSPTPTGNGKVSGKAPLVSSNTVIVFIAFLCFYSTLKL
ncbi:hypothetical protein QZH41_013156, partial [Actinostola sp. cb2023]